MEMIPAAALEAGAAFMPPVWLLPLTRLVVEPTRLFLSSSCVINF